MLKYSIPFMIILIFLIPNLAYSQYWFQTGAIGSQNTSFNNGVGISIETVYNQSINQGSYGFWVGETVLNNAFIQVGYLIENQTGYYPTSCTTTRCSSKVYVQKGQPVWFWEYFLPHGNETSFYGSIGTEGMANNGKFNNYSFKSSGNIWNVYMNGRSIGSVDLGVDSSGPNKPFAAAEDAGTNTNTTFMIPVKFRNFTIYKYNRWIQIPSAYTTIGYGKGSKSFLKNNYGIKEMGNLVNYFQIGSELPQPKNGTKLWSSGYTLKISSAYGNNGTLNYTSLSVAHIYEPIIINISDSERAVFKGWIGTGAGSYTGNSTNVSIHMYGNIKERAIWVLQDRINVYSNHLNVTGSGWYDYGSIAHISVDKDMLYINNNERYAFYNWSNNFSQPSATFIVTGPENITANWKIEYLINASSIYGNVIGGGWYDYGSNATISLNLTQKNNNPSKRIAFFSWNNGINSTIYNFKVNRPISIVAKFKPEYLQHITIKNMNGTVINFSYVMINNRKFYNKHIYLFEGKNNFSYVNIKGYNLSVNKTFDVSSSKNLIFTVQLYDVVIKTDDLFGIPINVSVNINFINGTSKQLFSGADGKISLHNVAYGFVNGVASFNNKTKYFNSKSSRNITVNFISNNVLIYAFIFALVIAVIGFLIARRYHKKYV